MDKSLVNNVLAIAILKAFMGNSCGISNPIFDQKISQHRGGQSH